MSSTHIRRHISAPRPTIYRALLDARAIAKWKVPDGMTGWQMALAKLAALVEEREKVPHTT